MWVWVILAAIGTFLIAAVAIGGVTGSLAVRPRRSVYDLAEAVDFVSDTLPAEVTSQLSFDDVETILKLHIDYLATKGVASSKTADDIGSSLVLIPDDEPVAWILGRIDDAGLEITDEQVVAVLDAEAGYYAAIGAIGPRVSDAPEP